MDKEQMRPTTFAQATDIKPTTLSQILNGRNNPSLDVVMKIHTAFPHINLEWLLTGEGAITNPEYIEDKEDDLIQTDSNNEINPINKDRETEDGKYGKDLSPNTPQNTSERPVIESIRYIEKPTRKIKEIKIFYDDETYETFIPQN